MALGDGGDVGGEGGAGLEGGSGGASTAGAAPASPSLSKAEAAARELAELEAAFRSDGAEVEAPPAGEDKPTPAEAPEGKPDKAEAPEKAKGKPEKTEPTLGESWKQVRAKAKALDMREADISKREAALLSKSGEFEGTAKELAKLKEAAALWDRVKAGDAEALEAAGLDYETLTQAVLDKTSGKSVQSRQERELKALREQIAKDKAEAEAAREKAEAEATYREVLNRFEATASKLPGLAKFSPGKREAMGNALAAEMHQAGEKVPAPEKLAELVAARLREEYAALRASFEDGEAPPAVAAPAARAGAPSTLSRKDSAERAPGRRKVPTPDEEMAEIGALLKG